MCCLVWTFMFMFPWLPLCVYLPARVYLTIGYYIFWRHQAHLQFHDFETVVCYYRETQWRQLYSIGSTFCLFVGSQKKLKHLTENLSATDMTTYDDWVASDCSVRTCILSSMYENVNASVMFLTTAKEIWNTLNIFQRAIYFSCYKSVWEVILTAIEWSFSISLLL